MQSKLIIVIYLMIIYNKTQKSAIICNLPTIAERKKHQYCAF